MAAAGGHREVILVLLEAGASAVDENAVSKKDIDSYYNTNVFVKILVICLKKLATYFLWNSIGMTFDWRKLTLLFLAEDEIKSYSERNAKLFSHLDMKGQWSNVILLQ